MRLAFMRHAESEANERNLLGGVLDFSLSTRGRADAERIAEAYLAERRVDLVVSSPLVRARDTALPFARRLGLELRLDHALIEQDMGVFAGMSYPVAEADPCYECDKTRRWSWAPPGGGESYAMIAERLLPFFRSLDDLPETSSILVVTHAVTLRLIRAHLEATLPAYPIELAHNGEILETEWRGLGKRHAIESRRWGSGPAREA